MTAHLVEHESGKLRVTSSSSALVIGRHEEQICLLQFWLPGGAIEKYPQNIIQALQVHISLWYPFVNKTHASHQEKTKNNVLPSSFTVILQMKWHFSEHGVIRYSIHSSRYHRTHYCKHQISRSMLHCFYWSWPSIY